MKRQPKRFCSLCGGVTVTRREDNVPRSYCETCGVFFYENPLPVVSTILLSDRKILLVKRGKKPYRGMWCLPTGFAEAGESIEDAALRELEEETGMRGSIVGLVDLGSAENYYYGDLLFVTFEVEATGGRLARGGDADTVRYFPLDRIPRLAFTSNKKAIEAFIRSKADAWAILDSFNLAVTEGTAGKKKKNLLSDRLIEVIEKNADRIAQYKGGSAKKREVARWVKELGLPLTLNVFGRSTRIRTLDPLVPNQVRYQAAPHSALPMIVPQFFRASRCKALKIESICQAILLEHSSLSPILVNPTAQLLAASSTDVRLACLCLKPTFNPIWIAAVLAHPNL